MSLFFTARYKEKELSQSIPDLQKRIRSEISSHRKMDLRNYLFIGYLTGHA